MAGSAAKRFLFCKANPFPLISNTPRTHGLVGDWHIFETFLGPFKGVLNIKGMGLHPIAVRGWQDSLSVPHEVVGNLEPSVISGLSQIHGYGMTRFMRWSISWWLQHGRARGVLDDGSDTPLPGHTSFRLDVCAFASQIHGLSSQFNDPDTLYVHACLLFYWLHGQQNHIVIFILSLPAMLGVGTSPLSGVRPPFGSASHGRRPFWPSDFSWGIYNYI